MQRERKMIVDDRCKRVMKKFRKRRRQRSSWVPTSSRFGAGIGGLEILEMPRVRRRTNESSLAADDEEDEGFVGRKPASSTLEKKNVSVGCYFMQQNRQQHSYQNHKYENHRRRTRVAWGEEIARRRAFSAVTQREDKGNKTTSISSEPELVHRKPESMQEFSFYSKCTFLDAYDKVLAVDNRGTLDILRLGDIRSQTKSGIQRRQRTSASHQKIVTNFELGAELKQRSFSTVHVQALSGGSTVAFGLEDDSLCLLDLEGRTNRSYYGGRSSDDILTPISFSAGSCPSASSLLPIFSASRTNHPRRTHYRDRQNPGLSLQELCRHRMNYYRTDCLNNYTNPTDSHDVSDLHAIDYTSARERISSPVRFIPDLRPPHDARWDILEIHPNSSGTASLLYVAHVDSDYDAFWTQVLDSRMRASTVASTGKKRNTCNATTILIDGTTRDRPGTVEEHVTACAMVTDVCMATAHISCGKYGSTPASEFFDRGLPYAGYSGMSSCVKLWDLRMVKKKRTGFNESPLPADTIVFAAPPAFEDADFALVEPAVTISTQLSSKEGSLAFSKAAFADEYSADSSAEKESSLSGGDHVITNLSAARDSNDGPNNNGSARGGSMIVTTQLRTKSTRVEHTKLDLGGTMRMTRKISQTNSNLGCQPVYAIASSHKYLATSSNMQNSNTVGNSDGDFCSRLSEGSTRISLYNLMSAPPCTKSTLSNDRYSCSSSRLYRQQREDASWSYQTDASLTDRYGVKTELSCIAMNSNGTALLGGTTDGDLFVWRGV